MSGAVPVTGGYVDAQAITASDTTVYQPPLAGVYVGTLGNLTIVTPRGNTVLFTAVPAGTFLGVAAKQVMATGTAAGALLGLT